MIQENNNTIATIGGTPAVAGTCTVTCVVTDGHGNSVTATPIDLVISGAVKMVAPKKVESAPAQSPKVEAPKPVAPAAPVADK